MFRKASVGGLPPDREEFQDSGSGSNANSSSEQIIFQPIGKKTSDASLGSASGSRSEQSRGMSTSGSVSSSSGGSSGVAGEIVVALYDWSGDKANSLAFRRGDTVRVLSKSPSGWWEGRIGRKRGWFPSTYVQSAGRAASLSGQSPSNAAVGGMSPAGCGGQSSDARSLSRSSSHSGSRAAYEDAETRVSGTTPSSRKNSVVSSGSYSVDGDSQLGAASSTGSHGGHYMESYQSVDTREPAFTSDTTYWLPQMPPNGGDMLFVDPSRRYVSLDIPFSRVTLADLEGLPAGAYPEVINAVNAPPEVVSSYVPPVASDQKLYEGKNLDPYAATRRRPRADSRSSADDASGTEASFEPSFLPPLDLPDVAPPPADDGDKGENGSSSAPLRWSTLQSQLHRRADSVIQAAHGDDYEAVGKELDALALVLRKVSLYAGIPTGTYPSHETGPTAMRYRKMLNVLSRLYVLHSLEGMLRYEQRRRRRRDSPTSPTTSAPAASASAAAATTTAEPDTDVSRLLQANRSSLFELVDELLEATVEFVADFKEYIADEARETSSNGEATRENSPPDFDVLESPPNEFEVNYYGNGDAEHQRVTISRTGEHVRQDNMSTAFTTLQTRKMQAKRRQRLPLESYWSGVLLDGEFVRALIASQNTVNAILGQFYKLTQTSPSSKDLVMLQGRAKVVESSLMTLLKHVGLVLYMLETINLYAFYSCRATPYDVHSAMYSLLQFLECKQQLRDILENLERVRKGSSQSDDEATPTLHMQAEDAYVATQRVQEQDLGSAVCDLKNQFNRLISIADRLAQEQESVFLHKERSMTVDDAIDAYGSGSAPASVLNMGMTPAAAAGDAVERGSIFSRRKESSAIDSGSISGTSLLEDQPPYLQLEYGDELILDRNNHIRGGSLRALVEQLTLHYRPNHDFTTAFFLSFRSFTNAAEFFQLLSARYFLQPPPGLKGEEYDIWAERKQKIIRLRVINVLKQWLDVYWSEADVEDLSPGEREELFNQMQKFMTQVQKVAPSNFQNLVNSIEQRRNSQDSTSPASLSRRIINSTTKVPPAPIVPKNLKKLTLSAINPIELARQLCIREFKLLSVISSHECLIRGCGGGKARRERDGNKIGEFIHNSNSLTNWTAYCILRHRDVRKRSDCLRYFIQVAELCRKNNNFSSMYAIYSALYSSVIHRLKRTWEFIPDKYIAQLDNIGRLMNTSRNFSEYRDLLRMVQTPAVPFFGVYLSDLLFVEQGNPDYLDPEHQFINFAKRKKTADIILSIRAFQATSYNFEEVSEIQAFLTKGLSDAPSIEDQYARSQELENKQNSNDKVTKILEENGILL